MLQASVSHAASVGPDVAQLRYAGQQAAEHFQVGVVHDQWALQQRVRANKGLRPAAGQQNRAEERRGGAAAAVAAPAASPPPPAARRARRAGARAWPVRGWGCSSLQGVSCKTRFGQR